jgi:gluconokinase
MPTSLPGSPYRATHGLVYFARMIDKIRLHAAGQLPEVYHKHLGRDFDGRCLRFLGNIDYAALCQEALKGGSEEELLDWCFARGRKPTGEEIEIWNAFMTKRGWRDYAREFIQQRIKESHLENRASEIITMFDFIDIDEGRTPPALVASAPVSQGRPPG